MAVARVDARLAHRHIQVWEFESDPLGATHSVMSTCSHTWPGPEYGVRPARTRAAAPACRFRSFAMEKEKESKKEGGTRTDREGGRDGGLVRRRGDSSLSLHPARTRSAAPALGFSGLRSEVTYTD